MANIKTFSLVVNYSVDVQAMSLADACEKVVSSLPNSYYSRGTDIKLVQPVVINEVLNDKIN